MNNQRHKRKNRSRSKPRNVLEDLMSALIENRSFQKLWQDEALDLLNLTNDEQLQTPKMEDELVLNNDSASASLIVDELAHSVHLCVETFLRSLPLALPNSDAKMSRETASLYSVRVQIDRLTLNKDLQLPQLRLAARRIGHLLKNFTIAVSSPFPVPSCSFLASSVCDLLYRFEELCSMNENLVPVFSCAKLRKSIDDFHYDIVKRLNMILLQRRPTTAQTTSSGIGTMSKSYSNITNFANSRHQYHPAAMGPTIVFTRSPQGTSSKSYLLPPELEEARSRLRRSKSMIIKNQPSKVATKNLILDEIENRWKNLLTDDFLTNFEKRSGGESIAALKASCKLTRNNNSNEIRLNGFLNVDYIALDTSLEYLNLWLFEAITVTRMRK
uniref:Uncharacterized protein n=1 Tax=Panagrolaimus sp. JU765 TaxID=591449 RepID=A0AC34QTF6_9BILA